MKVSKLVVGLAVMALGFSCSKDEENNTMTSEELTINAKMDEISDDVAKIAEDQAGIQQTLGRYSETPESMLPPCATVTLVVTDNTWTRTVDFGTTGCAMPNGNVLKGQIIISGSTNFDQPSYVINYSFVNFYHNNIKIEGNRTVTRTLASTATLAAVHPVATMDINMTVTLPNGATHTRIGTRVREMIEGFDTPMVWQDNVFSITGSWTTTFPAGTKTSTITTPLRIRMNCPHIVRGVIQVVRNDNTAIIDFGDGTCDNLATLTINGNTYTITLGN